MPAFGLAYLFGEDQLFTIYHSSLIVIVRLQIASLNGHLCHIRRTARDIISGQERTH